MYIQIKRANLVPDRCNPLASDPEGPSQLQGLEQWGKTPDSGSRHAIGRVSIPIPLLRTVATSVFPIFYMPTYSHLSCSPPRYWGRAADARSAPTVTGHM